MTNIFMEDDVTNKETIKLKISWKGYNLFQEHIPLKNFSIGENGDFELSIPHFDLIEKINDDIFINVPEDYKAWINGNLVNDKRIDLKFGDKIAVSNNNISFKIERTNSAIKHSVPFFENKKTLLYVGLSAILHVLFLFGFASFVPPLGVTEGEDVTKDNLMLIQQYLQASAERERESKQTEEVTEDQRADNKEGGTGTRAAGEEGKMGNPNSRDSNKRFGIAGPIDNKDIRIAREAALREAKDFGMIGLINMGSGGDPNAPTAIWGRDDSLGNDPISARGNMWGEGIGDAFGGNGLGLSGIGEGGGGRGEGIGLGSIGTIGHGAGTGGGQGFGSGWGRLSGGHKIKVPQVRMGSTVVTGRIPPEVIQRIVRQNYGRFRVCYETGLRNNPNLQGRVSIRFVIGRDGSVSNVSNGGSDIPDQAVTQCVIRSFYGLSFPSPEGVVTVVYPIMFSPQ